MSASNRKNRKSRLTAIARAEAFTNDKLDHWSPFIRAIFARQMTAVLEAHAAATLARHRRKVRA